MTSVVTGSFPGFGGHPGVLSSGGEVKRKEV